MTAITGNTYPVKDQLRAMGATWSPAQKAWLIDDARADQARAIVAQAPKSAPRSRYSRGGSGYRSYRPAYGSNYTRFSDGAEVYTNKNGRCEDAPCCGCCS